MTMNDRLRVKIRHLAAVAAVWSLAAAQAAPLPADPLEQRCWLQHTRERTLVNLREPTTVEFSLLRDGWRVRAPFQVDFAVRGMGVAPAGVKYDGTGHHHILVNRSLPRDIAASIPFDDSHRHFGKGQTGTLLDLPPGRHRLRLLFADHEHKPHFVYSREIAVQVLGARSNTPAPRVIADDFDASCQAWYEEQTSAPPAPERPLRIANLRDGEPVTSPFNLRLAADGWGIRAAEAKSDKPPEKSGHFVVEVTEVAAGGVRRTPQVFDLANGATQLNVFVAAGDWRLRLRLVDVRRANLLPPAEIGVKVVKQQAL